MQYEWSGLTFVMLNGFYELIVCLFCVCAGCHIVVSCSRGAASVQLRYPRRSVERWMYLRRDVPTTVGLHRKAVTSIVGNEQNVKM